MRGPRGVERNFKEYFVTKPLLEQISLEIGDVFFLDFWIRFIASSLLDEDTAGVKDLFLISRIPKWFQLLVVSH